MNISMSEHQAKHEFPVENLATAEGIGSFAIAGSLDEEARPDTDTMETADNEPEIKHRLGRGQVWAALRMIHDKLIEDGYENGIEAFIPETWQGARLMLPHFLSDATYPQIAHMVDRSLANTHATSAKLLRHLLGTIPADMLPTDLPQPNAEVRKIEGDPEVVGRVMRKILIQSGLTIGATADQLYVSSSTLTRFLAGQRRPNETKLLLPLMKLLKVPPELAAELRERYSKEYERVARAPRRSPRKKGKNT